MLIFFFDKKKQLRMQLLRTRREEALWEAERVTYEAGDFLQLTMNRYNNILYHLCIFRTFRIFLEHLELFLELTEKNVTKIKDKKLGRFQTGTEAKGLLAFILATCNAIFAKKKYCRLQLGCQTYATCFATCNEIIFYARRASI